jgi:hypothetical protein
MMNKIKRKPYLLWPLALLVFSAPPSYGQAGEGGQFSGVIPEFLIRPVRLRELNYPKDAVIGQLGSGEAGAGANSYARTVLRELMRQNKAAASLSPLGPDLIDAVMKKLSGVEPRKFRMGGGQEEIDGSVSFLFRFMGREEETAGELYIRADGANWITEDIIMGDTKALSRNSDAFTFEYLPYERFY